MWSSVPSLSTHPRVEYNTKNPFCQPFLLRIKGLTQDTLDLGASRNPKFFGLRIDQVQKLSIQSEGDGIGLIVILVGLRKPA